MRRNVLEYLEESADRLPKKTAVIDEYGSYTYKELLELSRKIGSGLVSKSEIGRPIAVLSRKSANTLATFLGIAYSGAFYVLLNPELPVNRLRQILEVLQPRVVIADEAHLDLASVMIAEQCRGEEGTSEGEQMDDEIQDAVKEIQILKMETLMQSEVNEDALKLIRNQAVDTNPLYANFTSGSTGIPKGVVVGHRSVLDFIDVFSDEFGINEEDIIGNQAPFDFDVSVKDIYTALKTAATLVIIPKELFSNPSALLDFICEHRVTTMVWAVSAVCLISTFHGLDYRIPEHVKRVLFSGEEMPWKHLKSWMEHLPEAEFVNLYGPTEITCNCTYYRVERGRDYSKGVPIGKAFPNEDVFLLDENDRKITESGQVGEICVRGSALALGYYRNPEQTAKGFVQNPLNACYPEWIYRTGDLASYADDGNLMFGGRKDFQIKYMGHRIELEEIERVVAGVEGVERCCVVFDHRKQRLHGFYMGILDKKELRLKLKDMLPIYMIPSALRQVDNFPLTKNGKVDRKLLLL